MESDRPGKWNDDCLVAPGELNNIGVMFPVLVTMLVAGLLALPLLPNIEDDILEVAVSVLRALIVL
jgi:hypothetical protein